MKTTSYTPVDALRQERHPEIAPIEVGVVADPLSGTNHILARLGGTPRASLALTVAGLDASSGDRVLMTKPSKLGQWVAFANIDTADSAYSVATTWNSWGNPTEEGQLLVAGASPSFTPSWTRYLPADIYFYDADGNSPALIFRGGSNSDMFLLWCKDDAVAGDSDLVLKFPAADLDSQFLFRSSGDVDVGYVDAAGNAKFVGHGAIGASATVSASIILDVRDSAIVPTGDTYGVYAYPTVTDVNDATYQLHGLRAFSVMNDPDGVLGYQYGLSGAARLTDGTLGTALAPTGLWGLDFIADLNGGTVYGNVYGARMDVDQEAANTVDGNMYGVLVRVDSDGTLTGLAYLGYLWERTNVDWCLYHYGGTSPSYLAGDLSVGATEAAAGQLHVDQGVVDAAQPVVYLDQADLSEEAIVITYGGDYDMRLIRLVNTAAAEFGFSNALSQWTFTDNVRLTDGDLYFATLLGIVHPDSAAGYILVDDGTRFVPANPAASLPVAPSAQGQILRSNATPAWEAYAANTNGAILIGNGTDIISTNTPTITGDVTLYDALGNSPDMRFRGATNNDIAAIFLQDNPAAAGDSSLVVKLCDDADSLLRLMNVSGATVATWSALGHPSFPEFVYHYGDADTYIQFQDNRISMVAGAVTFVDAVWGVPDYMLIGSQVRLGDFALYFDADVDSYVYASADDVVDFVLAGPSGQLGVTLNGSKDFAFTAQSFNVYGGSYITMGDDTWIGLGAAAGRITFDDQATDEIEIEDAILIVGGSDPDTNMPYLAGVYVEEAGFCSSVNYSVSSPGGAFTAATYGSDSNAYSRFVGRRARGSRASPSAAQSGDILGRLGAGGYGASAFTGESTAFMQVEANQNFTDAAMGTYLTFHTTPDGSITPVERIRISDTGQVLIGTSSETAFGTINLVIDQLTNDDQIMTFKSTGDVSHGMTVLADAATFGYFSKIGSGADGGLGIRGLSDVTQSVSIFGFGNTDDTGKATTSRGYVELSAGKRSGTSAGNAGSDANLVVIRNYGTTRFIFDAEGSGHSDIEWVTFDEHDDLALLDSLEASFGQFADEHRSELERLGIARFDGEPGHAMVNWTRLSMLLVGALRQVGQRLDLLGS